MPSGGEGDGSESPTPPSSEFSGFRPSSVDRSQGIYQEVQSAIQVELNKFRTESSASSPGAQLSGLNLESENWSFEDLSVTGIDLLHSTPAKHDRRIDSLATVYSQDESAQIGDTNNEISTINSDSNNINSDLNYINH